MYSKLISYGLIIIAELLILMYGFLTNSNIVQWVGIFFMLVTWISMKLELHKRKKFELHLRMKSEKDLPEGEER